MTMMTRSLALLALVAGCLVASPRASWPARAQRSDHSQDIKLRPVKRVFALPVIVYQPSAPIGFQDVQFVAMDKGVGTASFRIKNISNQPIVAYHVAEIHAYGGIGTGPNPNWGPFLPGETRPDSALPDAPLADSLPVPADEKSSMQTPVFLMVTKATMADGSQFDDEKAYQALKDYCARLAKLVDLSKPESIFADTK
jgi:hypothetical protein